MGARPKALDAWSGEFGDRYTERNPASGDAVRGRVRIWSQVLGKLLPQPMSALEVGPNLGLNLRALPQVAAMELWAIEPNASARKRLVDDGVLPAERLMEGFGHSIPMADGSVDLAFTTGVLIHVDPSLLESTMREIHRVSRRYIFCSEYFAPKPETIVYRGESDLLFKNDFGSLYLDQFPDLELVDYGFFWRRTTVMDDSTWWLFRKTA
jgi:spore coat polysaccharide biosynthesis protein SpsF